MEYIIDSFEGFESKKARRLARMLFNKSGLTMGELFDQSYSQKESYEIKTFNQFESALRNEFIDLILDYELKEYKLYATIVFTKDFVNQKSPTKKISITQNYFDEMKLINSDPKKHYEQEIIEIEKKIHTLRPWLVKIRKQIKSSKPKKQNSASVENFTLDYGKKDKK